MWRCRSPIRRRDRMLSPYCLAKACRRLSSCRTRGELSRSNDLGQDVDELLPEDRLAEPAHRAQVDGNDVGVVVAGQEDREGAEPGGESVGVCCADRTQDRPGEPAAGTWIRGGRRRRRRGPSCLSAGLFLLRQRALAFARRRRAGADAQGDHGASSADHQGVRCQRSLDRSLAVAAEDQRSDQTELARRRQVVASVFVRAAMIQSFAL